MYIASEEYLLKRLKKSGERIENRFQHYFRTDENRLKALKLRNVKKDGYAYIDFIESLDDDNLKVEFLRKTFIADREEIIRSIKDEKIREKLIPKYLKYAD